MYGTATLDRIIIHNSLVFFSASLVVVIVSTYWLEFIGSQLYHMWLSHFYSNRDFLVMGILIRVSVMSFVCCSAICRLFYVFPVVNIDFWLISSCYVWRACGICIVEAEKWMPASLCLSITVCACVCVCLIANSIEISSFNRSSRLYKNSRQSQTHKHAHERNETRSHTHKESHKCRMRYGQK